MSRRLLPVLLITVALITDYFSLRLRHWINSP
jgi:hypothetical protein